jgi:predicted HicB family RNase H-like nuclease
MTPSETPASMQGMSEPTSTLFIRHINPELKTLIVAEAAERKVGMNDLVVGVLAERFSIPFEPTGQVGTIQLGDSTDIVLRMPTRLRRSVAIEAARRGGTIKGVVSAALDRHFSENRTN